jgi:hypothetical protein
MIEAIKPNPIAPFRKVMRSNFPLRKQAIIIPVTTLLKQTYPKRDAPDNPPDSPIQKWIMPLQEDGYIKCRENDFL